MSVNTYPPTPAHAGDVSLTERFQTSPRPDNLRTPRPARVANKYSPSILRPHVLAEDRLARWTTPYVIDALAARAEKTTFGLATRFSEVSLASVDWSTRKNYGTGLLLFTQFCDRHNIDEWERMPASESLLALFITSHGGGVARTTIDTWLAGLTLWHSVHGAPWHGGKVLKTVCNGAARLQPPKQVKRQPVTIGHLHALFDGLDLTDSFDAAVYAVACVAFWGCRRCEHSLS